MTTGFRFVKDSFLPLLLVLVAIVTAVLIVDAKAEDTIHRYTVIPVNSASTDWQRNQLSEDGIESSVADYSIEQATTIKELQQARSLWDEGRLDEAESLLINLNTQSGSNPFILNELGVMRLRREDPKGALSFLDQAINTNPKYFRAYYNRAIAHSRLQSFKEAETDYYQAIAHHPNHFESVYNLGLILLNQKKYDEAEKTLKRSVELGGGKSKAAALFSLARVQSKNGKTTSAIRTYEKSIEYRPDYLLPRYNLAILLSSSGDTKSSERDMEILHQTISLAPRFAPAYFALGRMAWKQGNIKDAEKWYREAVQGDASFWKARYNLGLIYIKRNQMDKAENHFKEMMAGFPNYPEVWFNLGKVAYAKKQYEESEQYYRTALEKSNNTYAEASLNLGIVLKSQNKIDEAIDIFNSLLEKNHNYGPAYINKGLIHFQRKEYDDARASFIRALDTKSKVRALYHLGLLESKLKRYDEAAKYYQNGLALDPNHIKTAVNLGLVFSKANRLEDAEEAFRHAVRIDPSYAVSHFNLALTLRKQNKLDEAILEYKKVIELDGDHLLARHNLGVAYAKKGNSEEAAYMFSQVLDMQPSNVKARYNYALQHRKMGNNDTAEVELTKVLKLEPNHFQSYITLAKIAVVKNRPQDAISLLTKANSIIPDNPEVLTLLGQLKAK